MVQLISILAYLQCITTASAHLLPYKASLRPRKSDSPLQVDLGYSIYEGYGNSSTGINTWKGIRFAKAPLGNLRWQRPQPPAANRSSIIQAQDYGDDCYQIGFSFPDNPSLSKIDGGSEDCLFLNVQAPSNARKLPVMVWIHGGGYGGGSARQDLSTLINTNDNSFMGVTINYRVGPWGFLASDEVHRRGVVNAGLLDQFRALQWVQEHIEAFGGDPTAVTIAGESAGGGSVMLQDIAYGGRVGDSLFRSTIAASPYLPKQLAYNDKYPTESYNAFAAHAGCAQDSSSGTIFDCLVSKDASALQNASIAIASDGPYGTFRFLPVTDGAFLQHAPSTPLLHKKVNGRNMLSGNNANEAPYFVPTITTEAELVNWLHATLPEFNNDEIANVLRYYPCPNTSNTGPLFATSGYSGPSALDQSSVAVGYQQRADNIYAELTFVCPSYWLAEAYSGHGRKSYKYQFSTTPGWHGADQQGYFGPFGVTPTLGPDFQRAFMKIWGNFITTGNPSISDAIAAGNQSVTKSSASDWPMYSKSKPYQLNLNQTGGVEALGVLGPGPVLVGDSLRNNFTLANAYTWEAGRGARCEFWRSVGSIIPA